MPDQCISLELPGIDICHCAVEMASYSHAKEHATRAADVHVFMGRQVVRLWGCVGGQLRSANYQKSDVIGILVSVLAKDLVGKHDQRRRSTLARLHQGV